MRKTSNNTRDMTKKKYSKKWTNTHCTPIYRQQSIIQFHWNTEFILIDQIGRIVGNSRHNAIGSKSPFVCTCKTRNWSEIVKQNTEYHSMIPHHSLIPLPFATICQWLRHCISWIVVIQGTVPVARRENGHRFAANNRRFAICRRTPFCCRRWPSVAWVAPTCTWYCWWRLR